MSGNAIAGLVVEAREKDRYILRLYVTGMTPRSTDAVAVIRKLCEDVLAERYQLDVIDLYEHPEAARAAQIIASPTLVKELPPPLRRLVGGLSDRDRLIKGLDLDRGARP